ncbi:hypothetical protein TcWFU_008041 [Taenia crassiceps]|uniref:Uncharacterized protein n=1 Tax=Taenia crassiceps TaxID=6207 RepID=A0ABR4Q0B5_9CEST
MHYNGVIPGCPLRVEYQEYQGNDSVTISPTDFGVAFPPGDAEMSGSTTGSSLAPATAPTIRLSRHATSN